MICIKELPNMMLRDEFGTIISLLSDDFEIKSVGIINNGKEERKIDM